MVDNLLYYFDIFMILYHDMLDLNYVLLMLMDILFMVNHSYKIVYVFDSQIHDDLEKSLSFLIKYF